MAIGSSRYAPCKVIGSAQSGPAKIIGSNQSRHSKAYWHHPKRACRARRQLIILFWALGVDYACKYLCTYGAIAIVVTFSRHAAIYNAGELQDRQ
jgi:hypothetical protein